MEGYEKVVEIENNEVVLKIKSALKIISIPQTNSTVM